MTIDSDQWWTALLNKQVMNLLWLPTANMHLGIGDHDDYDDDDDADVHDYDDDDYDDDDDR